MREELIDKAKFLSFSVFQNPSNNKYVIEYILTSEDIFLLEEQELDKWLLSVNRIPEVIIGTETALGILEKMI
ncbi:hypothetical protein H1P_3130005 [Hyella patelloides LEGE 07179]|uniref:Uncharacterized protein n=1 Tax=Hyella patelloides LEGE 07179 TaxID=945734 RepID=A0A563VUN6_9CYAN|nr:hypothetical protein [Hyella patelloides]VEP15186.1 hypothetical protein H1P_3130005 [Hyella patelloides LEGE 07179]